jgi:hypothetical protein
MERVRQAGLVVDGSTDGSTPKLRRRHSDPHRRPAGGSRTPEQAREARSLRRVFLDMGDSYREYRRRTGAPVSADVRDAADRFRQERNVTSLAAVAASLDELHVLTW